MVEIEWTKSELLYFDLGEFSNMEAARLFAERIIRTKLNIKTDETTKEETK